MNFRWCELQYLNFRSLWISNSGSINKILSKHSHRLSVYIACGCNGKAEAVLKTAWPVKLKIFITQIFTEKFSWPLDDKIYMVWCLSASSLVSLSLSPLHRPCESPTLCRTRQALFCLRAFAHNALSTWDALPPDFSILSESPHLDLSFLVTSLGLLWPPCKKKHSLTQSKKNVGENYERWYHALCIRPSKVKILHDYFFQWGQGNRSSYMLLVRMQTHIWIWPLELC